MSIYRSFNKIRYPSLSTLVSMRKAIRASGPVHSFDRGNTRSLTGPITAAQEKELDRWAQKAMVPVSLKNLLETGAACRALSGTVPLYIYINPVVSPGRGETVEVFKKLAKVKGEDMTPDELIGLQVNLHPAL